MIAIKAGQMHVMCAVKSGKSRSVLERAANIENKIAELWRVFNHGVGTNTPYWSTIFEADRILFDMDGDGYRISQEKTC